MSPFVATLQQLPRVRLCQARDHDIADEVVDPLDPTTDAPAGRVAVVQRVPRSAGDPQPRAAHAATADAIAEQVPSRTVAGQPAAGIVQQCHHPVVVDTVQRHQPRHRAASGGGVAHARLASTAAPTRRAAR